jgi:DNA-binding SARP family transcriptional activator/class 3 adenylate cyclase/TolB-like protein/tetratricopeptide (TPR) repeat protein
VVHLKLLGGALLDGDDGPVRGRAAHKRRIALLAVLAASRSRPVGRERLVGLLWPEHPNDSARHLLSESLYVIRRELGDGVLVATGDDLALNRAEVRCDAAEFEDALAAGETEAAVALYHGPYLDGFVVADAPEFERWAEAERDRLARSYARALERLAEEREGEEDAAGAVEWWRRLAAHDPYSSRVALRLMRALDASGERAAAIRHAGVHAVFVRNELGTEPDGEVLGLAERLRAEPPPAPAAVVVAEGLSRLEGEGEAGGAAAPRHRVRDGDDAGEAAPHPAVLPASPVRTGGPGAEPLPVEAEPRPVPSEETPRRRAATVWFANVVRYDDLLARDPAAAARVIETLHETARREIRRGGGHLVELIGDGALAEFERPRAAVVAALRLAAAFERRTREAGAPAMLRVGVHLGEMATTPDGGIYGEAASVAARLQGRAEPGEVLATEEVWRELRADPELRFASRGVAPLPGRSASAPSTALFAVERERRLARADGGEGQARSRPVPRWPVVLVAAGLAAGVWTGLSHPFRPGETALADRRLDPARIAVPYCRDLTPADTLSHLSRGISEQLIYELSQVDGLAVISENGVRPYRGQATPAGDIAAALGAGTVVDCSMEQSGGMVRVNVALLDPATRRRYPGERIQHPVGELFGLEDDLARTVSLLLRERLGRVIRLRTDSAGTRNPRAHDLLFRGKDQLRRAEEGLAGGTSWTGLSRERLRVADSLLARAGEEDPDWAAPVAMRAWVAYRRGDNGHDPVDTLRLREGWRLAQRALEMNPAEPAALEVRGRIAWDLAILASEPESAARWVDAAVRDLRAAVEADPRRGAPALNVLAQVLSYQGEHAAAYVAAEEAVRTDAFLDSDRAPDRLLRAALWSGQFELAWKHCDAGHRDYPRSADYVACRLLVLARDESTPPRPEAADSVWAELERLGSVGTADRYLPIHYRMLRAAVLARAGWRGRARAEMARARSEWNGDAALLASWAYDEAHVRLFLGDRAGVVRALSEVIRTRPVMRRYIANDYLFRSLHAGPGFP